MNLIESQTQTSIVGNIRQMYPSVSRIVFTGTICAYDGLVNESNELAHTHLEDGIICITRFDSNDKLSAIWKDSVPTILLLHEIAHTMAMNDENHGKEWQDKYNELRQQWGYSHIKNPRTSD